MDSVKLQDTKIHIQKSVAFLYRNNISKEEIKKTVSSTISSKTIKGAPGWLSH